MTKRYTAEPATQQRYEHGEGIRYDAGRGELLWVDIGAGHVMVAAPDGLDAPRTYDVGRPVGVVAPRTAGGWILGAGRGFARLADDGRVEVLAEVEPPPNRMNDGAADPQGRFWCGSMAYAETPGAASLHRLDPDGRVETMLADLTISNGIGWSPDGATMYLNDSGPGVTYAFDFDGATGGIERQRILVRYEDGVGDGLAVDAEGFLWAPLWGGSRVERRDPDGKVAAVVELPVSQPSCCCLADGRLYVTTASKGLSDPPPDAGRLFVAEVGVSAPGVAAYAG